MQRFFCASCGAVRRVRVLPPWVGAEELERVIPSERISLCRRHHHRTSQTNPQLFNRVTKVPVIRHTATAQATPKKSQKPRKSKGTTNHYEGGE